MPIYVTASLRLDLVEAASAENGCIDKFSVWVEAEIVDTFAPIFMSIPIAPVTETPYYLCDNGYIANPPDFFPFKALTVAFSNIKPDTWEGYGITSLYGVLRVTEFWFHRSPGVDISSTAFSTEWANVLSGGKYLIHFAQPAGFNVAFNTGYIAGFDGFGAEIYQEAQTLNYELPVRSCSSGGGGGGGGSQPSPCPCSSSRKVVVCGGSSREAVSCAGSARRAALCAGSSRKACG